MDCGFGNCKTGLCSRSQNGHDCCPPGAIYDGTTNTTNPICVKCDCGFCDSTSDISCCRCNSNADGKCNNCVPYTPSDGKQCKPGQNWFGGISSSNQNDACSSGQNVASALSAKKSYASFQIRVLVNFATLVTWLIRHIWILVVPMRNVAETARLVFLIRRFVGMFLPARPQIKLLWPLASGIRALWIVLTVRNTVLLLVGLLNVITLLVLLACSILWKYWYWTW